MFYFILFYLVIVIFFLFSHQTLSSSLIIPLSLPGTTTTAVLPSSRSDPPLPLPKLLFEPPCRYHHALHRCTNSVPPWPPNFCTVTVILFLSLPLHRCCSTPLLLLSFEPSPTSLHSPSFLGHNILSSLSDFELMART